MCLTLTQLSVTKRMASTNGNLEMNTPLLAVEEARRDEAAAADWRRCFNVRFITRRFPDVDVLVDG